MVGPITQPFEPVGTLRNLFFSPPVVEIWSSCTKTMAVLEKDFGCGVKREDLVLIGGIWGWWRSRMRAQ